jgi:ATP-binding cassette subfamily B multidrug efflux pump
VQFAAYLALLAGPVLNLGWMATTWQQGRVSLGRLDVVLAAAPVLRSGARVVAVNAPGHVELDRVSLTLDGRQSVVEVSFSVAAGSLCALVGATGAGKSLLMSLLPRVRDPDGGRVLLDGIDVRELSIDTLRRHVALASHETGLFDGSIRDNIAFGVVDGDDLEQRVTWAAHAACLTYDLEQMPEGLDTPVGEGGELLSGGQRQRTALARALAARPRVLVLDDALSAVDAETEHAILANLSSSPQRPRPTTLLVSHRFAGAMLADQIVVLERGAVVETGTHAELLERRGTYARLWRAQRLAEDLAQAVGRQPVSAAHGGEERSDR